MKGLSNPYRFDRHRNKVLSHVPLDKNYQWIISTANTFKPFIYHKCDISLIMSLHKIQTSTMQTHTTCNCYVWKLPQLKKTKYHIYDEKIVLMC